MANVNNVVGFVPLRAGSKGVPNKNISDLCGRPLFYWCVRALLDAEAVDSVVVSSDSPAYRRLVRNIFKGEAVVTIDRSAESATDEASPELALREWGGDRAVPQNIIVVYTQATNPWTLPSTFDKAVQSLLECEQSSRSGGPEYDSPYVVGAARCTPHIYRQGKPLFDPAARGRHQDSQWYAAENGSIYAARLSSILESGTHKGTLAAVLEQPAYTSLEVDEPEHLIMARALCAGFACTPHEIPSRLGART